MPAARVVPALDEVEEGKPRVGVGAEALTIEQLALEGRKEALEHGVVERVADTAHRRPDTGFATPFAEGDGRVLAALVRVMNHVRRSTLPHRHVQRREDELRVAAPRGGVLDHARPGQLLSAHHSDLRRPGCLEAPA